MDLNELPQGFTIKIEEKKADPVLFVKKSHYITVPAKTMTEAIQKVESSFPEFEVKQANELWKVLT